MRSGIVLAIALMAGVTLVMVAPAAAQNPWVAEGGYYEQYDSPAGRFTPHTLRWIWTSSHAPGEVEDFVAFFDCWRIGPEGGIGSNKFILQWKLTGLDSDTVVKLPKWKGKLEDGFLDSQTHVVNQVAPLAGESMVLVEALLKVKGTIGANEYVGCDMDLSEHPDGFTGEF